MTMKTAVVFGIFFSVCCFQEVSAFCGNRQLTGDLVRAAVQAAEWIRANLYDNTTHTEGHILATALHSLRLVGKSVNKISGKRSTALLKSELDITGLESIPTGRIALYIHGVYAACKNPRMFYNYNLVKHLKIGIVKYPKPGFDNYFQYSTAVLAMCISGYTIYPRILVENLASWTKSGTNSDVETVAMATTALSCMCDGLNGVKFKYYKKINKSVKRATKWLSKKRRDDWSFGNSSTTALVAQALLSAEGIGGPYKKWQCTKTMRYLLQQQQNDGSYGDLMSTVQVMPVLIGAVPADLKKLKCHKKIPPIKVCIRLEYTTRSVNNSMPSLPPPVSLKVPSRSNAYKILRLAAKRDYRYRFTTRKSKRGLVVTSIQSVRENPQLNMYWMMYSNGDRRAPSGIDSYRPKHNTCVIFKYMKL